jgi:hypothetical protein
MQEIDINAGDSCERAEIRRVGADPAALHSSPAETRIRLGRSPTANGLTRPAGPESDSRRSNANSEKLAAMLQGFLVGDFGEGSLAVIEDPNMTGGDLVNPAGESELRAGKGSCNAGMGSGMGQLHQDVLFSQAAQADGGSFCVGRKRVGGSPASQFMRRSCSGMR